MEKAEVLAKIHTANAEFESLLAQLNEAQMLQSGVQADWSVKDVVAHLDAWQTLCAEWLELLTRGETPPGAKLWTDEDVNRMNQQFYDQQRKRSLSDALASFHHSQQQALKQIEALSTEDINQPRDYAWREGKPLVFLNFIAGNTFGHYGEHLDTLRAWVEKFKTAP